MKELVRKHMKGFEALLCASCGLALAACFYVFEILPWLAWFLPAPVFFLLFREGMGVRRALGLSCAFVFPFLFASYCVGFTIDVGFSPAVMFLIDLALVAVVSLVQGIPLVAALLLGAKLPFPRPLRAALVALMWTAGEWLTTAGVFAFPVRNLAVSQWGAENVVRLSSLFGTLFVSFLMILVAALIAQGVQRNINRAQPFKPDATNPELAKAALGFPIAPQSELSFRERWRPKNQNQYLWSAYILFVFVLFGGSSLLTTAYPDRFVEVAAVQHNVPIDASSAERFDESVRLAKIALSKEPGGDILIFPESTAQYLDQNDYMRNELEKLAKGCGVDIIVGGVFLQSEPQGAEPAGNGPAADGRKSSQDLRNLGTGKEAGEILENAVFYVSETGGLSKRHYAKQLLVPFFENGNIRPFTFIPGHDRLVFETAGARAGVLVCLESIISESVRETANRGAEIIVVVSNDAYLKSPFIKWMHFSQDVFRAAECGRAVIQASTNGVTGVTDPNGHILNSYVGGSAVEVLLPIETAGVLEADVPIYSHTTLFSRIGYAWIAILAAILFIIFLAEQMRMRRKICKGGAF